MGALKKPSFTVVHSFIQCVLVRVSSGISIMTLDLLDVQRTQSLILHQSFCQGCDTIVVNDVAAQLQVRKSGVDLKQQQLSV